VIAIRVSTVVPAAPDAVWEDLRHIDRHVEWMRDADSIRFLTDTTEGSGVLFECVTRFGPFRLTDRMEVVDWCDARTLAIRHSGAVAGAGEFRLTPCPAADGEVHTEFEWSESLRFPWWMGGAVGAVAARPLLRAVWRRSLDAFTARF